MQEVVPHSLTLARHGYQWRNDFVLMLDNITAGGHYVRMRTPIPLTPEQVTKALNDANGDTEQAAAALGVSEKTLKRRIKKFGLERRVQYEAAEAA